MSKKTLAGVLGIPEAQRLQDLIIAKGESPTLDSLDDPQRALRFAQANLRGAYLFGRFAVPAYAAAVFGSLTDFPPVDDDDGRLVARIVDMVRGELLNNNIFNRPGECHSHYHDMREAYEEAGGDMIALAAFMKLEREYGFDLSVASSPFWSNASLGYVAAMLRCCADPLAMFIMMPANEEFAPFVYSRACANLSREPRFDKFRLFLGQHVDLDTDDHGPVTLEWLDRYVKKAAVPKERLRQATETAMGLFVPSKAR